MPKTNFLYPRSTYRGQPQHLAFNTELQEFSQRLSYLCALEANGKMPQEETFQKIEAMWNCLERQYLQDEDRESEGYGCST
jgi:hypothetical protein